MAGSGEEYDYGVPYKVVARSKAFDSSRVFENKAPGGYVVTYTTSCCYDNGYHGLRAGIGVFFGQGNPLYAKSYRYTCTKM